MAIVYTFLAILASILIYFKFLKIHRKGKIIPGPKGLPILGKALEISMETIHEKLDGYARKYGDIVQIRVAGDTLICLNSVELIRKAFTEDPYKRYLSDRPEYYYGRTFINGSQSMGFSPDGFGVAHSVMRKGFSKGFHVYGDGVKVFEENIMREVNALLERIDQLEGEDIEAVGVIRQSIANVLSYLLSGDDMTEEDLNAIWSFNTSLESLLNFHNNAILNTFPFLVRLPGYYKTLYDRCSDSKQKLVHRYFTKIKESHRSGTVRGMVDFFLEEQRLDIENGGDIVWTDDRIIGNILDLFAAGILTTLSVMTNTILCLMHNPDCQIKLQEELDVILGVDRPPALSDRSNCPYLEAVVMECQRLIPALPLLQIHTTKEDIAFEGYHLPANSVVIPNAWHTLHKEDVWGDPWKFRPERFLDENGQLLPTSHPLRKQWIPFGLGRRQCIAEQFARSRLFLFLSSLFRRYRFTPSPGRSGSCDPRSGDFEFTVICRAKPFFFQIQRR